MFLLSSSNCEHLIFCHFMKGVHSKDRNKDRRKARCEAGPFLRLPTACSEPASTEHIHSQQPWTTHHPALAPCQTTGQQSHWPSQQPWTTHCLALAPSQTTGQQSHWPSQQPWTQLFHLRQVVSVPVVAVAEQVMKEGRGRRGVVV